jgi:hypothetical protein
MLALPVSMLQYLLALLPDILMFLAIFFVARIAISRVLDLVFDGTATRRRRRNQPPNQPLPQAFIQQQQHLGRFLNNRIQTNTLTHDEASLFRALMRPTDDFDGGDFEALNTLNDVAPPVVNPAHPLADWEIENLPIKVLDEVDSSVHPCSICLEAFNVFDCVKTLPCNHVYHETCVTTWLKQNDECPVCRAKVRREPETV